jgi:hypothetical protein
LNKIIITIKTIITENSDKNIINFKNYDINYQSDKLVGYTKVSNDISELNINFISDNIALITHNFEIDLHDIFPKTMQNIVVNIIKMIFYKLKIFCENIKI